MNGEVDEVVRRMSVSSNFAFAPAEEGERGKEGRRGKSRDRQIVGTS